MPADFDAAAFERIAKMIFIRLQAANDKSDVNDLRAFTTPELFSSLKLDLQDRADAPQQTDVVTLNAELLDFAQENERQIVSVRFHGLIREEARNGAEPFDEVWHLVRPTDAKSGSLVDRRHPAAPVTAASGRGRLPPRGAPAPRAAGAWRRPASLTTPAARGSR